MSTQEKINHLKTLQNQIQKDLGKLKQRKEAADKVVAKAVDAHTKAALAVLAIDKEIATLESALGTPSADSRVASAAKVETFAQHTVAPKVATAKAAPVKAAPKAAKGSSKTAGILKPLTDKKASPEKFEKFMTAAPAAKVTKTKAANVPATKAAPVKAAAVAPAGVRLKKDGTPAKKPGPAKKAEVQSAAPAPVKAAPKAAPVKAAPVKAAPAPTTTKAAPVKAAKAAPAPVAAAPAAPAPKATKAAKAPNRAAQGRRAVLSGERPTLKDAMKQVMGTQTMNAQQIYDALKAKNWLPNSDKPKEYIGYSLSSMKDSFERVTGNGRGFYRVKTSIIVPAPAPTTASPAKNGHSTNGLSVSQKEMDESLKVAGELIGAIN